MSISDQAGTAHQEKPPTLARDVSTSVMDWARTEGAFKHMVSFNMLEEAVEGALGAKTSRRDVTADDVHKVGDAVRTWIEPHLAEGKTAAGVEDAIARGVHRPIRGERVIIGDDAITAYKPKGAER